MGGRVDVDTTSGRGTTVRLRVRLGVEPASESQAEQPAAELRDLPALVVDDSPVNRQILCTLLRGAHALPTPARGKDEALAMLRAAHEAGRRYRFALIDVDLGGDSGIEAAQEVKADPLLAQTTLIALGVAGGPEEAALCRAAGMEAYLVKPVRGQDLLDVVQGALMSCAGAVSPTARGAARSRTMDDESSKTGPLDEGAALERAGGERALLVELAGMFLSDAPVVVETIRDALADGDAKAVQRAAHKLKGSLLVLAADPASHAALRLETLGAQGALDQAAAALEALEREIERLKPALASLASATPDAHGG
jgi:CheY-like chemotaxis protein